MQLIDLFMMKEFEYLDNDKKLVQYDEEMGDIKNFDEIKNILLGKSIDEQKKHFYLSWWAPHFSTRYTPLYEEDKPVIIKDNIIVGVVLGENLYLLAGTGISEEEESDNNGAGYKEYSEETSFEFTRVPLDVKRCHYLDCQNEFDFFEAHKCLEEVIIDETVEEIESAKIECPIKYIGSISHWLALEGYKSVFNEVHLYLNGDQIETTKVVIPDNVQDIFIYEFYNCKNIKEIVFPKNLQTIQPEAFHGCTSLEKIDLPDSVSEIATNAFNGCISLKEIRLPRGPFSISNCAFSECKSLKEVYIPCSCKYMEYSVFYLCDENLKIKCAVSKEYVENNWSNSWNERYSDRNGCYSYDIEWIRE